MTRIIQIFSILFSVGYGLTFAILAILQASIGQYNLALQDVAWMGTCIAFGALLHRLLSYYRKRGKRKQYFD